MIRSFQVQFDYSEFFVILKIDQTRLQRVMKSRNHRAKQLLVERRVILSSFMGKRGSRDLELKS